MMGSANQAPTPIVRDPYCTTPIVLVGVISAYEGFIQSLFQLLCSKSDYMNMAIVNMHKLTDKDLQHLRLAKKKNWTEKDLKDKLKRATLHDPVQISNLAHILFNLKFPFLEQDTVEELLKKRNLFTHHGGVLNGKEVKVEPKYVFKVHANINKLINYYVRAIKKDSEEVEI